METFIQPKITGYRQLSEQEVELMNEGKELAKAVGDYVAKLGLHPATSPGGIPFTNPAGLVSVDQRWLHIGITQLQQGFMALTRSIAQPTTF